MEKVVSSSAAVSVGSSTNIPSDGRIGGRASEILRRAGGLRMNAQPYPARLRNHAEILQAELG